jgi:hypothetical protein
MANGGGLSQAAYNPALGMATPLWAEAPGRYKPGIKVDAQFDPTGMRRGAYDYSQSLGAYMLPPDQNMDTPVENVSMLKIDPYSGQIIGNSRHSSDLYNTFNADPNAWFKSEREKLMGMPETTQRWVAEEGMVSNTSDRAQKLSMLDKAEADYKKYQGQFGDWQSKYTNPELGQQLAGSLNLSGMPNLESDTSALNRLNSNLMRYGISDINQVGSTQGPNGEPIYYNRETGQQLPGQIGHFKSGSHGTLRVGFRNNPDGSIGLSQDFEGPKQQFGDYMGQAVLATLLATAGGALGGALSSAAGGTAATAGAGTAGSTTGSALARIGGQALGQGISGGIGSVMRGGDFGSGFLPGAISGGVGAGVGTLNPGESMFTNPTYAGIANRAVGGGLSSAINAGVRGGNPMDAFARGAFSGGVGSGLTQAGKGLELPDDFARQVGGFGSNYLTNQVFKPTPRRRG